MCQQHSLNESQTSFGFQANSTFNQTFLRDPAFERSKGFITT
jgi:hypothetical protein